jgi:hypothetical protein
MNAYELRIRGLADAIALAERAGSSSSSRKYATWCPRRPAIRAADRLRPSRKQEAMAHSTRINRVTHCSQRR